MLSAPLLTAVLLATPVQDPPAESVGVDAAALQTARQRGAAFLKTTQSADGTWPSRVPAGITALAVSALRAAGLPNDDPAVAKGLAAVAGFAQEDGRIAAEGSRLVGYETAICVSTLADADAEKYADILKRADGFLRGLQFDEESGSTPDDPAYGGAGYGPPGGRGSRPDLSNTAYLIEALRAAGAEENDPAIQKALIFVSRSQNLEGAGNDTAFASKINDGGFYYTPTGSGSSPAGETENGGLRSYGSMTYAGLKSMVYAGVGPNDPRVQAANRWIAENYNVNANPGLGTAGLFYYYQLFGKSLDVAGKKTVVDAAGVSHDWRAELSAALLSIQRPNGSWSNQDERWLEGDPTLATSFALLALGRCDKPEE